MSNAVLIGFIVGRKDEEKDASFGCTEDIIDCSNRDDKLLSEVYQYLSMVSASLLWFYNIPNIFHISV